MNTVTKVAKRASELFAAGGMSIPTAATKAAKEQGIGAPHLTLRVLIIENDAKGYGVTEKDTLVEAVAKVLGTHGAEKKNGKRDQAKWMIRISPPSRKPVQADPVVARTFRQTEQLQLL
jgi:hypothetical protein